MNLKFNILILFNLLYGHMMVVIGQEYSIRHFNPENGLNGTYVYVTIEDSKGYKWVGTDYGLSRFDGLNFETIDRNDSSKTSFPTAAVNTHQEVVLFGYYNGVIKKFNGVELETLFNPGENSSAIRSIVEDEDGIIWALTQNDGVIKIDENKVEQLKLANLINKKSNVLICQSNIVFIGTNEGLLIYKLNEHKTLEYYSQVDELSGIAVQDIVKRQHSNTYWVGTDNDGIYQLITSEERKGQLITNAFQTDFLQDRSVVCIKEINNKDLWVATKYSGLIKVNFNRDNSKPRQFTFMNQDNGFPGDQTSTMFFDKNENVWIGTIGDGLVQVSKKGVLFYNFEKFRATSVNCISGTKKHEFLFGTDKGIVKASYAGSSDSLNFRLIDHATVKNQNISAIYINNKDKIFFGVRNEGLFCSDANFENVIPIRFNHNTKRIKIRNIIQDDNGLLWLSIMHSGVFVIDTLGNIVNHYATKTGFFHNEIYQIHIDSRGNRWFAAHSAGLAIMKPDGQVKYLSVDGTFPARDINDISEDESGNIWIGTYGNGVYEYDGKNFIRFSAEDGLLNNYCNSVVSDRNNHIWVSHRLGLSRIDEYTGAISTVQEKDGLPVSEFIPNSIYRDQDHNIWLGNRNGVTFLNAPDEMFEPKTLETIITDVKIDHNTVNLYEFSSEEEVVGKIPAHLIFPYDHNNLTFEYIAINLEKPQSNLYQFRLDGYEKKWSPATNENYVSYTNLNPGKYKFLIRQSDNPNHWTDNITVLEFTITPSWWNTWWARSLFIMMVIMIIYFVIRVRTIKLRKRLAEKRQFLEITENQNKRLKNFSFITSHNIRSSVGNLFGLIEILEYEPDNKEYFDLLKSTVQKLDITLKHISDLLNFENKVADMERVDCDILETIERVITLNAPLIKDKEAIINVDIPKNTMVKAIPAYLDSVYNNLITNAIRYGTTDKSKKISINAVLNGHKAIIYVKDYGLGLDLSKHKKKLFQLGARFHSAKSDGHGLGLFMSKYQLDAMGAKIEVESEVDKGTVVAVYFDK